MVFSQLRKPKYTFQIFNHGHILDREIHDAGDLINFIEEENERLLTDEITESVIVAKLNRKGEIFIAQKLELPMAAKTDFDELLGDFYSKKYIPFDEAMFDKISDNEELDDKSEMAEETESHDEAVPAMPEEMKALLAERQSEVLQTPDRRESTASKEMAEMMAAFKQQQETIAALTKQLQKREHVAQRDPEPEMTAKSAAATSHQGKEAVTETATVNDLDANNLQVDTMIVEVKQAVSKRLSDYAKQEQAKIDVEMAALDQREQIPEQVKAIYQDREAAAIREATQKNEAKKARDLEAEKKRHEAAMAEIKLMAKKQLSEEIETIEQTTQQNVTQAIKVEYDKQTQQLDQVLEGKLNELQLGQSKLNQALQANFENALATFNADHQKVMAVVEEKKTSANVLPLNDQYQLAK